MMTLLMTPCAGPFLTNSWALRPDRGLLRALRHNGFVSAVFRPSRRRAPFFPPNPSLLDGRVHSSFSRGLQPPEDSKTSSGGEMDHLPSRGGLGVFNLSLIVQPAIWKKGACFGGLGLGVCRGVCDGLPVWGGTVVTTTLMFQRPSSFLCGIPRRSRFPSSHRQPSRRHPIRLARA